jgi:hypothetical protein
MRKRCIKIWRKGTGIEPARDFFSPALVLKTREDTSPLALPLLREYKDQRKVATSLTS